MRRGSLFKRPFSLFVMLASLQMSSGAAPLVSEPPPDESDPFVAYRKCGVLYGIRECIGYAGKRGATILDRPETVGRVLARKEYGKTVVLLEPALKLSDVKWLPTTIVVEGPRGPFTERVRAWVRREEVVLNSDFRRVAGCWPLSFVVVPEEELEGHPGWVGFTVKGVASARNAGGVPEEFGVQRTYYAEGIFTVRHPVYATRGYFAGGTLDYGARTVKYLGEKVLQGEKQVRWFGSKELEGCKEIPTVDDTRVPKQRWPEKDRGG